MKMCPVCQRELQEHLLYCPFDGSSLLNKDGQDPLVGMLLDDKYRIEELIGKGGMGKVYRATHVHMDNAVALKILHPHLAANHTALERFRREARAAAYIRHPNAVAVTDFGVTKDTGMAYLVMEFLEGTELRKRLEAEGVLDFEEAFYIVRQTCMALHAAHSKGIIHRDLKPDNIWLFKSEDGSEHVKVLDFGIAKLKSTSMGGTLTEAGMLVGTPYYMSPEQCRGDELDARSDLYSLGIIMYEMLTGSVPFQAETPIGVVLKHTHEEPRPLHELRADIPPAIERVVLRTLCKKPDGRPGSAAELTQEFEEALSQSGHAPREFHRYTPALFPRPLSGEYNDPERTLPPRGHRVTDDAMHRPQADNPLAPNAQTELASMPSATQTMVSGHAASTGKITERGTHQIGGRDTDDSALQHKERPAKTRLYLIIAAVVIALAVAVGIGVKMSASSTTTPPQPPPQPKPTITPPAGMVLVKGGTFKMGTDDPAESDNNKPAHDATVGDFFIDINEVTNGEYQRFVKEKNYPPPPHWTNGTFPAGTENLPVWNVSWEDATAYAQWAGKRLPTEAEWEYAARGPEDRIYPWGNQWSARYSNSKEDGQVGPVTVGTYASGKSWCGVNDMAGNVAEWVADDYQPYPGSKAKPQDKLLKDFRGGAFYISKDEIRSYHRWAEQPSVKEKWLGFRCAKDVK